MATPCIDPHAREMTSVMPLTDPKTQGESVRNARKQAGMSRRRAAKLVGISLRELLSHERGQQAPAPALLARLAAAYGSRLSTDGLLRRPTPLIVDDGQLQIGDTLRTVTVNASSDILLREYLDALYHVRRKRRGASLMLRGEDVTVLSGVVDLDPAEVERRLIEMMQVSGDEAAAVRRLLVQRRVLVPVASVAIGASALFLASPALGATGSGAVANEVIVSAAAPSRQAPVLSYAPVVAVATTPAMTTATVETPVAAIVNEAPPAEAAPAPDVPTPDVSAPDVPAPHAPAPAPVPDVPAAPVPVEIADPLVLTNPAAVPVEIADPLVLTNPAAVPVEIADALTITNP